jgi:uncharacterized membrane protein
MEHELYAALDERLRRLERDAAALRTDLTAAAPAPAAAPAAPAPSGPPPVAAQPSMPLPWVTEPQPKRAPFSFEVFFAGRGLQLVGLFLVLLGVAFFLDLAFTRGWIGPAERILLGLLCGLALIAAGARRLQAHGTPVSEGLIGLGAGIVYLSLWASVAVFPELHVARFAAFAAMVAVTATLTVLSATRRSQRVALLGLAGGFLTPLLLSTDTPDRTVLAAYVLVLGIAFTALAVRARFRFVEGSVFVATALYLPAFGPAGIEWSRTAAYVVSTAIFALFAIAFTAAAARERDDAKDMLLHLVLFSTNALLYAAMLGWAFSNNPTTLGIALLVLSAASLIAAALVPAKRSLTHAYAYVGLAAVTLALPALLHDNGHALVDAFALEGAILAVLGARRKNAVVAAAGSVLLSGVALWLFIQCFVAPPSSSPMSSLALSIALTVAVVSVARSQLREAAASAETADSWNVGGSLVANVLAVAGITRILLDGLGGPAWNVAIPSIVHVAISLAWTAYATAMFGLGLRRGSALLQRLGLGLLAITIFKVFAVDLSNVDIAWRIVSFVVLGMVCMGISAWYLRSRAAAKEPAA